MARVTVEDSLEQIPNRFELVLVASRRARDLSMGAVEATVPWNNDKPTVIALREIAMHNIDASILDTQPTVTPEEAFGFKARDKIHKKEIFADADDFAAEVGEEDGFNNRLLAAAFAEFQQEDLEKTEESTSASEDEDDF